MTKQAEENTPTNTRKQKLYASLALFAVIFLICAAAIAVKVISSNSDRNDTSAQQNNESSSTNTELLVASNVIMSDILAKTEGTTLVFVGKPTCGYCAQFQPILLEVLAENPADVYYYNTDDAKAEGQDEYSAILSQIEVNAVPALIKIQNGVKTEELDNYTSADAIIEFIRG